MTTLQLSTVMPQKTGHGAYCAHYPLITHLRSTTYQFTNANGKPAANGEKVKLPISEHLNKVVGYLIF